MKLRFISVFAASLAVLSVLAPVRAAWADDKAMIDSNTERALSWLRTSGDDTADLLQRFRKLVRE